LNDVQKAQLFAKSLAFSENLEPNFCRIFAESYALSV